MIFTLLLFIWVRNLLACFKLEIYAHKIGQNNLTPGTQEVGSGGCLFEASLGKKLVSPHISEEARIGGIRLCYELHRRPVVYSLGFIPV
jgi:hypothetical protein